MIIEEQIERDITSVKKSIEDTCKAVSKLQKEQDSMIKELNGIEVRHLTVAKLYVSYC